MGGILLGLLLVAAIGLVIFFLVWAFVEAIITGFKEERQRIRLSKLSLDEREAVLDAQLKALDRRLRTYYPIRTLPERQPDIIMTVPPLGSWDR